MRLVGIAAAMPRVPSVAETQKFWFGTPVIQSVPVVSKSRRACATSRESARQAQDKTEEESILGSVAVLFVRVLSVSSCACVLFHVL